MNILIIGGGGVIGQKLGRALAARGELRGKVISGITLADIVDPARIPGSAVPVKTVVCNIADPASVAKCVTADVDVIYLLAAVVSAHAEEDLDAGLSINMMGTLNVLQHARALGTRPVLVFTSSIAVNGGEVPQPFTDYTGLNPQTSYGAQKAIGELLVTDFSRRGLIDGRGFRLPTISIRPGKPNRAASGFMSSIFREPLQGRTANCPVSSDFNHYYLSPRKCVENLIKGAELPAEALGLNRCMPMPGRVWTIRQMIDAMTAVAGSGPARLISWEKQPGLDLILDGWRMDIRADKAESLGLEADASFEDNIRYFLEDDLPGA
ncbi:nucleoside-diphosphate-sugar epimerase [Rhodovulum imhoffii]|uniref:Nucleoside-diphosphate-sugar epimerase n=1 Tax=Rhodovulum imhoffii TaxID=365340 RepID=A0A2T5BQC2_9RHOB|nr:D-erythronate dehydrogenase [Rhodovulum imhoffii]MBK5933677.1 NAD-dependent dehydratase [Rhodovulum imhoffii]PTN01344.1 nucleoside-diphosphate-sugar epimerase [Rhodovulum imhoffii]